MKAKLGMTVQPPKKTPYDKIGARMLEGAKEQRKLERQASPYNQRIERKLPKVAPSRNRGGGRA